MYKIGVIGTTCVDIIHQPNIKKTSKLFGGIMYIITALSGLLKDKGIIIPVTKIEKSYRNSLDKLLKQYPNIQKDFIYDEPGKTNIVELFYDNNFSRVEKSILGSTSINFRQIKPVLNSADLIVITFISGYDISIETLEKIRKSYSKTIFGDIHSFILTKTKHTTRKYKSNCNYKRFIKNFDILQGSEIEWKILLKKWKPIERDNYKEVADYVLSLGPKKIIITMGKDGVFGAEKISNNKIEYYSIPPMKRRKVVDTTGCGDTMSAGIIWGLLKNLGFHQALSFGNFFASIKAIQIGFFSQSKIEKIIKTWHNKISE